MKTKKSILSWFSLVGILATQLPAEQLLENNDFKSGMSGWSTLGDGFSATGGSDQWGNFIDVQIANGGSNPWDVKLYQDGITLEKGYEYTLEWGATRSSGSVNVGVGMAGEPYTDYLTDQITFSGDYLDHSIDNGQAVTLHYCGESVSGLRFYVDMGGSNEAVKLAWVSLGRTAKACDGSSSGELTNPGNGPVPYYGELKVSGNKIIGKRSQKPAQVRGMSLYWSVWGGEKYYNANAIKALKDTWKVEVVRAAMGVDVGGGYAEDPQAQMERVETVIQAAIDQEIYVIVDFHSHNAHNYASQAKAFFGAIAQKYGQHDNVIFEVFNEPLAISWNTIRSYAVDVIAEIRKNSDNLVIVGTSNWSQDVDQVLTNKINDPNVAYTLHFYAGSHGTDLRNKAKAALNGGVALFVTEWGTVNADGDGGVATTSSNEWMAFMDQYKLSWANWSLHDKVEGASALKNGTDINGAGWGSSSNQTASGQYVFSKLTGYASSAAWRTAPKTSPVSYTMRTQGDMGLHVTPQAYILKRATAHQARLIDASGKVLWSQNQPAGQNVFALPQGGVGIQWLEIRQLGQREVQKVPLP